MVDTISSIRGIASGVTRYAPSSAASSDPDKKIAPVPPADGAAGEGNGQPPDDNAQEKPEDNPVTLQITEDPSNGELIYRFVDTKSGEIVREWDGRDLGRMRDYVRNQRIHLIDRKI